MSRLNKTKLTMLGRVKSDNKLVGYLIADKILNSKFMITKNELIGYEFENATVCKDNKVRGVGSMPEYQYEQLFGYSINQVPTNIILYHGSMYGIQGRISPNSNRGACDFGNGFYTGDNLDQSINRISNTGGGTIYQYGVNLNTLKSYKFTNDIDWALFVAVNRHKLSQSSFKRLDLLCKKLQSYDVIIGHIADDKIADILNDFVSNNITDRCLIEGLKLIKYGSQYSFRTEKACKSLQLIDSHSLTADDRKKSIEWGRIMKSNMQIDLAIIRERYEYTGFRIKDINYYYK